MSKLKSNRGDDVDELYNKVLTWLPYHEWISPEFLEQEFSIDFIQAMKILDRLEEAGVISSPKGSNPRKVYVYKKVLD